MITTTMAWDTVPTQTTHKELCDQRDLWCATAYEAGKTQTPNSTETTNGDTVEFQRVWTDQAAADEWTAFITALATQHGLTVTVTEE
jgi:hypothetical protein